MELLFVYRFELIVVRAFAKLGFRTDYYFPLMWIIPGRASNVDLLFLLSRPSPEQRSTKLENIVVEFARQQDMWKECKFPTSSRIWQQNSER